jgi:putative alpha-1,2-mannosidase
MEIDGVDVTGSIAVPVNETTYDQAWETVTVPNITLTAGTHIMRFVADSNYFDLNSFTWTLSTTPTLTPTPTNTPIPTPTPLPTATPTPAADSIKPTVSITSPANGSTVARRTSVTITATATDNVGIAKVEFYINNNLLCTDTSSPYTCNWQVPNAKNAQYTITAKAYDAAGNTATTTSTVTAK